MKRQKKMKKHEETTRLTTMDTGTSQNVPSIEHMERVVIHNCFLKNVDFFQFLELSMAFCKYHFFELEFAREDRALNFKKMIENCKFSSSRS